HRLKSKLIQWSWLEHQKKKRNTRSVNCISSKTRIRNMLTRHLNVLSMLLHPMEIFLRSSWKPLKSPVLVKLPMPFIKWVGNTEETCKRERLGASSIGHGSTGIRDSCPIGAPNRTREHRNLDVMSNRRSQSDTVASESGIHVR